MPTRPFTPANYLPGMSPCPTFVAFDFETADWRNQRPCSIGLVRVENGRITRQLHRLIHQPRTMFCRRNMAIHGIRPEDVALAPSFAEVWKSLQPLLADVEFLAAHNMPFDRSVLNHACTAAGLVLPDFRFVCTVRLAKRVWRLRSARLPLVAAYLQIPLDAHHHALADATVCAQIVVAAAEAGHSVG